jgi:hypothetical protein
VQTNNGGSYFYAWRISALWREASSSLSRGIRFSYNTYDLTDAERAALAVKSGEGKPLTTINLCKPDFRFPGWLGFCSGGQDRSKT